MNESIRESWLPIPLIEPWNAKRPSPPDIAGLLYRQRRHALSGEPESAKTLLALILALEWIRTTPGDVDEFLYENVAYLDFEGDRESLSASLAELGATAEEVARIAYFNPEAPPDDVNHHDVYKIVCEMRCGLVIFDAAIGAYEISDLDDSNRKEAARFDRIWVRPFWECGAATLVIDHVAKDEASRGRWSIGSERKLGMVDVKIGVDVVTPISRGTSGIYKLIGGKDRRGYHKRGAVLTELHLSSDPETHHIAYEFRSPTSGITEAGGWKPTILMARVSQYVIDNPGSSRTQIEQGVKGKSRDHIRQAIDELTALGHLQETEGSRKSRTYTSLSPFTPPDPAPTPPGAVTADPAPLAAPSGGEASRRGQPGAVNDHDPAAGSNGNGHVDLTPDEREPLFEDGHLDQVEIERLAEIAREAVT